MGMKISNFIIAIVLTSLTITIFLSSLTSMMSDYGVTLSANDQSEYDNWSLIFDKTDDVTTNINTVQNETFAINPTGLTDILGGFVASSIAALKTAWQSFSIFTIITFKIAEILSLPQILVNALITILIIAIVIGVIISTMVKKDV